MIAFGGALISVAALLLLSSLSALPLNGGGVRGFIVRIKDPEIVTGLAGVTLLALGLVLVSRAVQSPGVALSISLTGLAGSIVFGYGLAAIAWGLPCSRLAVIVGGLLVAFSWTLAGLGLFSYGGTARVLAGLWLVSLAVHWLAPVVGALVAGYFMVRAIRGGRLGGRTRRGAYPLPLYVPGCP